MPSSGLRCTETQVHTHTNIHTQINRLNMLIYQKLINLPLVKLIMKNLKRSKGLNKRIIFQILFRKNGSKMKAHDLKSAPYPWDKGY